MITIQCMHVGGVETLHRNVTTEINLSIEDEMENYLASTNFDFWGNERDEREVNNIGEK